MNLTSWYQEVHRVPWYQTFVLISKLKFDFWISLSLVIFLWFQNIQVLLFGIKETDFCFLHQTIIFIYHYLIPWYQYVNVLILQFDAVTLRKQAYSNILKIYHQKNESFQMKNSKIFHISAQNIDCRYLLEPPQWGGSNEYPQSMFLSRNKKNNVYPCKPQFYYIKVGFKGVKIIFTGVYIIFLISAQKHRLWVLFRTASARRF